MPPRSILLVAHLTPPAAMSAARRPAGLTRYLAELGHRVIVLTSVTPGSGGVPGAARTIRTRDLLVSPFNWRRASFAALRGEGPGSYVAQPSSLAEWFVPDLEVLGWIPFALPQALALSTRERFDCVITSSPPQSGHLVGLALRQRSIPWVADFRDGWTFERRDRPGAAHPELARLDRGLERIVVRRADAVCAVTDPIAADLAVRFDRPVATITNGFDPATPTPTGVDVDGLLSPHRRSLVHTGNLAFGGRSLDPLVAALSELSASAPAATHGLEIVLIGPVTQAERDTIERAGLRECVRLTGPVPRDMALAAQRAADGLLVITGPQQTGVATGKLFEYLVTGRPIIVIGEETAAARIVERTAAGITASRDDPRALAAILQRFIEAPDELPRPSPEAVRGYAYPTLAGQMAEQVELAIARARNRPSGRR